MATPSFLINAERAQAPSALKILSIGVLTKWLSFQGSPHPHLPFCQKIGKKKAKYYYSAIPLSTSQVERKLILLHVEIIALFFILELKKSAHKVPKRRDEKHKTDKDKSNSKKI